MPRTAFTETEALLIALDQGESEALSEYVRANFLPGEARKLARACRALSWTCNDQFPIPLAASAGAGTEEPDA